MSTRVIIFVAVVILIIIVLGPTLYEHLTGVGVMKVSTKVGSANAEQKRHPAARAYIRRPEPVINELRAEVPIYSVNEIYASLGVGPDAFSRWQDRYGFESFGIGDGGVRFVPHYPVLSKIAWMGLTPIDLSSTETSLLIEECSKAKSRSVNAAAKSELDALIILSQKALTSGGTVSFGLP